MNIREIDSTSRATVDRIIEEQWMGPVIVTRGKAIDTSTNPGFVLVEDGDILGFITYLSLIHISKSEGSESGQFESGRPVRKRTSLRENWCRNGGV